jgi:proton-translocating NADH-quinone oxidoreductase chain L
MRNNISDWHVGLYVAAVLIPLAAFAVQAIFAPQLKRINAYIATGAIVLSFFLSLVGFGEYFRLAPWGAATVTHAGAQEGGEHEAAEAGHHGLPMTWKGEVDWVSLGGREEVGTAGQPPLVLRLGVAIDNLGVIMFLMVTFIASLIHIYSMGYMHDDPRYPRFFAYLSLFCFSMLGLVASSNVFMTFIFWELVGVCSYLLIGFWYEEKVNCDAANKAFIVNRVGDVGMLVGLGLLWAYLGTFDFQELNGGLRNAAGKLNEVAAGANKDVTYVELHDLVGSQVVTDPLTNVPREIPLWVLTLAGLGIFAGCVGKSAQFPLHVWLPDAMAGPTPVSALIHAATMVAAGVFLVGRFFPLFTGDVLLYIAYTGGITLFIAATIAMVQTDYKKVLAYSTVSQLGFMMLGLGVGGWVAGLFHLITHAFFKALLFLCAGSVYHSVHTYEMPALGGLFKKMPYTALTMLIGTLAISGVPGFSGFYSKDAILAAAMARVWYDPEHFMLFVLPAVGAVLTAFYMFRMWFLVFTGEPRGFPTHADEAYARATDEEHVLAPIHHAHEHDHDHGHDEENAIQVLDDDHAHGHGHGQLHDQNPVAHAHESEPIMVWPLIVLAVMSVIAGWGFWYIIPNPAAFMHLGTPLLERMLEYGEPYRAFDTNQLHNLHYYAFGGSAVILLTGLGVALLFYGPKGFPYFVPTRLSAARAAERFGGVYKFLVKKWYFDDLYWAVFVRPCLAFARLCREIDIRLIDGLVNGSAALTRLIDWIVGRFDVIGVDRLVNLTAETVYAAGDRGRAIQTGRLRNYLMFLTVALVGLFAGVFAWIRG